MPQFRLTVEKHTLAETQIGDFGGENRSSARWRGECFIGAVLRSWLILIISVVALVPAQSLELPFEFREGLLWVQVRADTGEGLNFLFDTGAAVSTLNLATARRMGLKPGRKASVQGVHTILDGYWQEHVTLKAGGVSLATQCLAVDLSKLSCSCERPVDGLIGADFLRGRIVEIDFERSKIRLLESTPLVDERIPLEFRSCGVRVPMTVNGREGQFVRLDTGCATALQWVTTQVPQQCTKKMAIGLIEVSIPQTITDVSLGGCSFENVPTGLHKKAIFPGEKGLLGNGLLSRFASVTIDAKNGYLLVRKRHLPD